MTLDAFAGRSGALREEVHALRPHPGQVETAQHLRELLAGSTLVDIPYHLVPRFRTWLAESWSDAGRPAAAFRHRAGTACRRPAPRTRSVLPALPAVQGRQEAPAAGCLLPALHAAGARRGARCAARRRAA